MAALAARAGGTAAAGAVVVVRMVVAVRGHSFSRVLIERSLTNDATNHATCFAFDVGVKHMHVLDCATYSACSENAHCAVVRGEFDFGLGDNEIADRSLLCEVAEETHA